MSEAVCTTTPAMTSSPVEAEPSAPAEAVAAPEQAVPGNVPPPVVAPERYDLALDGFTIDPALVQNADPVLRDIGLTNAAANKLLPVARDIMARTQESLVRQIEYAAAAQKKTWHDAFVADPEIGGAHRGETEHFAAKALDALGYLQGHPFRQALNDSGFGNHPDLLRAFRRLGELLGEDGSFVRPLTAASRSRPVWERLYPDETR